MVHRRSRNEDFAEMALLAHTARSASHHLRAAAQHGWQRRASQAQTVRKWAMRLAQALRVLLGRPVPVIFWDERLTTFAAQELMADERAVRENRRRCRRRCRIVAGLSGRTGRW